MAKMTNCTLIGLGADCPPDADGVLVVGDYTIAEPGQKVAVGHYLNREAIPESVRHSILANPAGFAELFRIMGKWTGECQIHARNDKRKQIRRLLEDEGIIDNEHFDLLFKEE